MSTNPAISFKEVMSDEERKLLRGIAEPVWRICYAEILSEATAEFRDLLIKNAGLKGVHYDFKIEESVKKPLFEVNKKSVNIRNQRFLFTHLELKFKYHKELFLHYRKTVLIFFVDEHKLTRLLSTKNSQKGIISSSRL